MTDPWPQSVEESRARLHAKIMAAVEQWDEDTRMDWAEMAATLEYEQGNPRDKAEQLAFWRIKKDRGL